MQTCRKERNIDNDLMKVCIQFKKSNVEIFAVTNRRIFVIYMFMLHYPQHVTLADLDLCVMTHAGTVLVENNVTLQMVPVHLVVNPDIREIYAKKVIILKISHIQIINKPCGHEIRDADTYIHRMYTWKIRFELRLYMWSVCRCVGLQQYRWTLSNWM